MPEPLTPLSDAVESLHAIASDLRHIASGGILATETLRAHADAVDQILDAVAEGREKITAMRPVVDAAIGVMDQLNSFNDPSHPEVHRQHLRLQAALAALDAVTDGRGTR